jgi:hypothetical protein
LPQQQQQQQQQPVAHQPPPPPPPLLCGTASDGTASTIDLNSLDTVIKLITSVGILGDGHTGNPEADALFYLFQELKTLKYEVETAGLTIASMQAKRRKLAAEQDLARANLEVADIEEQLIRVAMINKQKEQQQQHWGRQDTGDLEAAAEQLIHHRNAIPIIITAAAAASPTYASNANDGQMDGNIASFFANQPQNHQQEEAERQLSSLALPLPPDPENEEEPKISRRSSSL